MSQIRFNNWRSCYETAIKHRRLRKGETPRDMYRAALKQAGMVLARRPAMLYSQESWAEFANGMSTQFPLLYSEAGWYENSRPYYNVWPSVASSLAHTSLEIPSSYILEAMRDVPKTVLIRLPVGHEIKCKAGLSIYSILLVKVHTVTVENKSQTRNGEPEDGICVQIDSGVRDKWGDPVVDSSTISLERGSIKQALDSVNYENGAIAPDECDEMFETAYRLVCAIAMIHKDPALVQPEVMPADRKEFERTGDEKLVKKAARRGMVGWNVGANVEVAPHYRRPHFGIRWTEKGRSVPKLVPIKGAIIKRSRLSEIPTGYLDKEEQTV